MPEVEAKYSAMKADDHLMRLTIVAFSYLDDTVEKVEFTPEFEIAEENSFKRNPRPCGRI
jgi:hypothetical protein